MNNNNSNNSISNNNNNNTKLFFSIFRNIYIKNKIFYYLHLYNIFSKYILFSSCDKIIRLKSFIEYFKCIYLEDEDEDDLYKFLELIPTNVDTIKIDGVPLFCSNIYSMHIPSHIKNLILSDILNESENSNLLPDSLKTLQISDVNKQLWRFPQNLEKLTYTISNYRNKFEIIQESDLPRNLKYIKLVNCSLTFYYPLPSTLRKLKIYNKVLDFQTVSLFVNTAGISFPPNVQVLYLNDRLFNQPLNYYLPRNLLKLELDSTFDQVISIGVLPQSLIKLVLKNESPTNGFIDGKSFPLGLKTLKLGSGYSFDSLPSSLTNIACNHKLIPLFPNTVAQYKFDYQFESFFFEQQQHTKSSGVPPSLASLIPLPNHIKIIKCVSKKNNSFKELFSKKLSNIVIDSYQNLYNIPINSIIPLEIISTSKSITSLDFSYSINDPIPPNTLPLNLKSLKLNWYYDQPFLQNTLPQSLQSLSVGYYFKHSLENLPNLLILEILNGNYNLTAQQIPSTLKILIAPFIKLNDEIITQNIETIFIAEGSSNNPIDYIDFNIFNKLKLYNQKKLNIFKKLNKKLIYN